MRKLALGLFVIASLLVTALAVLPDRALFAQHAGVATPVGPESGLIALSAVIGDKYQQVTVIDPKQQVMSVYHVELSSGNVELRCVRNIHWDLQMMYFNGKSPLPQEILSMIQAK